ncbi:MAG: GNAT family N-acetyltransferase [Promethearchaeota archaeon]
MEWIKKFEDRVIEPEKLHEIITPGSRICIGSGCSEPVVLTNQLVKESWRYPDCEFLHFYSISNQKFFSDDYPTSFRHNSLSVIGCPVLRSGINSGKADFIPITTYEAAEMILNNRIHVDVALVQLSPPDKNGYCSLGINVDLNRAIIKNAKIVVAHINPAMPRTMGDSFINLKTDIDYFYHHNEPLLEIPPLNYTSIHEKIAMYVARLIENGSTLNLGTGKITYCLPKFLKMKKNLALYSEVLQESIVELIQNGNVTCNENYYPHCMTSFILGTKKFYDFVDDNPFIEFHAAEFISSIGNIAHNTKLCSVYGAIMVDLLGQATNHIGTRLYSGIGGEADFMRGSAISPGGKAVVALPSKNIMGESRIMPYLPAGPMSLRAIDVHYVVTEYGIAYLHGKSIRQRVLQMISIAAPEFRGELLEKAKSLNFVYKDQILPATREGVVIMCPDIEWIFTTKTGRKVTFRPVKPTDERMLQDLYYSLSEDDRIHRFLSQRKVFPHEDIQDLMNCDYQTSMLIIGVIGNNENMKVVAEGAYYLEDDVNLAEISVTLHPDFRNQGLAFHLFDRIIELAKERGISGLCGEIYVDNHAIFHILNSLPYKVVMKEHGSTYYFEFKFSDVKGDMNGKNR